MDRGHYIPNTGLIAPVLDYVEGDGEDLDCLAVPPPGLPQKSIERIFWGGAFTGKVSFAVKRLPMQDTSPKIRF
jgi:hypothetical protein